jgi:hypothetical protein
MSLMNPIEDEGIFFKIMTFQILDSRQVMIISNYLFGFGLQTNIFSNPT